MGRGAVVVSGDAVLAVLLGTIPIGPLERRTVSSSALVEDGMTASVAAVLLRLVLEDCWLGRMLVQYRPKSVRPLSDCH